MDAARSTEPAAASSPYIGDWSDTYQRQQRPSAHGRKSR